MKQKLFNNKDKRSGIDRRNFSFDFHIPERRSGNERRNGNFRKRKLRTSKY